MNHFVTPFLPDSEMTFVFSLIASKTPSLCICILSPKLSLENEQTLQSFSKRWQSIYYSFCHN